MRRTFVCRCVQVFDIPNNSSHMYTVVARPGRAYKLDVFVAYTEPLLPMYDACLVYATLVGRGIYLFGKANRCSPDPPGAHPPLISMVPIMRAC